MAEWLRMGIVPVAIVVSAGACFDTSTGEAFNAPPFSAELVNLRDTGRAPTRVYIGSGRLRLESTNDGKTTAFVFDPQHGTLLVIDDQAKTYIDAGMFTPVAAAGMRPFLRLLRPAGDADPCVAWNATANQFAAFASRSEKRVQFSCAPMGADTVSGRSAHKWSVRSSGGSDGQSDNGTVWIDDRLHVVSKSIDPNGSMVMRNIRDGSPSADLFAPPVAYQKISVTDFLTKLAKGTSK